MKIVESVLEKRIHAIGKLDTMQFRFMLEKEQWMLCLF